MKNKIFSGFLLLVVSILFSSYAVPQVSKEGDSATKTELKKIAFENRKLKREIASLEEAIKQVQAAASEDRNLIKDKFSLVQQGSIFTTGILSIVLTVIGIGIGIAGIAVYKIIDYKLARKYQRIFDEGTIDVFVKIYKSLSHAFYLYYKSFFLAKTTSIRIIQASKARSIWPSGMRKEC